ncbi:hypothetical protein PI124_g22761 [Phytophthora idaei]|nr:hypothetical protein PI124_g22761 [Phytophthora idaei]
MPPRRPVAGEDKSTASTKKQSAQKKKKIAPPPLPPDYVSPAKKRREELDKMSQQDIGTIKGLQEYIGRGMPQNEKVTLYARFLWKSHHEYNTGNSSWRLHMYDAANDQPIDELLSIYHDGYDDGKASAGRDLATVSIWEDWGGTTNCPDLATSSSSSALQAFGCTKATASSSPLVSTIWSSNFPDSAPSSVRAGTTRSITNC